MDEGRLFVVSTPIGNLDDLSPRALEVLRQVDLVAAEDTRRIGKLLKRFEIQSSLLRCDENIERKVSGKILDRIENGASVALVSDAGAPNLSDPGAHLVAEATKRGIQTIPIPGPSAITTAVSVCGFSALPFTFVGFLHKKGRKKREQIERIEEGQESVVFFESPFRIRKTFDELHNLVPDRLAYVGRELTKLHEEHFRGSVSEIAEKLKTSSQKGEFTGVIAGKSKKELKKARQKG